MHSRFGKGDHKIELVDSATMNVSSMHRVISNMFDTDPNRLEVMRIDLAADVADVPVSWFAQHVFLKDKMSLSRRGVLMFEEIAKRQTETLLYGARPNVVRIYDKISEYRHQYRTLKRQGSCYAPFQDFFGVSEDGILTRVERQIGGAQAKRVIGTVKNLRHLPEFNPFKSLLFLGSGRAHLDPLAYPVSTYLKGLGLRALIHRVGLQEATRLLNRGRNAKRLLTSLRDFLPVDELDFTEKNLVAIYKSSVTKQLAA